ncbi:6-O-methylguanine DNA methyltransferase [Auriculariales sp. MPI-PUGE-AT-0066]|nr:6-O-methylguanine DNA methyltransferase [Auriculariales sp. MPI-PUGE-AT-0066]
MAQPATLTLFTLDTLGGLQEQEQASQNAAGLKNGERILQRRCLADGTIHFPTNAEERAAYRDKDGKSLSSFQWAVYDFTCTIPVGKLVTYKDVATSIKQGSPRSVGGALKHNPFAPRVPCHRIIASDLSLGGYIGEWTGSKTRTTVGPMGRRKIQLLAEEGIEFDKSRRLKDRTRLWSPSH